MQIVIEIPEAFYKHCKSQEDATEIQLAVKNGVPLPKGHGDLIDRNDLLEYTDINRSAYIPVVNRYEIITAPTIIEADKEEEE